MLLDFTLPLEPEDGNFRFHLPLLSDLKPVWDFKLTGEIAGVNDVSKISSPGFDQIKFNLADKNNATFSFSREDYKPPSDLLLTFQQKKTTASTTRNHLAPALPKSALSNFPAAAKKWMSSDVNYFLATIPEASLPTAKEAPPVDLLILADTSSGIRDLQAVRRTVHSIAQNLPGDCRIRVGCVDREFRAIDKRWQTSGSPEFAKTLTQFDREFQLGGTDLYKSLQQALVSFKDSQKRRKVVVYIGDGVNSFGTLPEPRLPKSLVELCRTNDVSFCAVLIRGDDPTKGTPLLKTVATATGGIVFNAHLASSRRDLFRWTLAGAPPVCRVKSVQVKSVASNDLQTEDIWLPGKPLYVYGRTLKQIPANLQVTLSQGGSDTILQQELQATPGDDPFVGRLWAAKRISHLKYREKYEPRKKGNDLSREMAALSREWTVLCPYTAFLVLETEQDYPRWGIQRQIRRRYWQPKGQLKPKPIGQKWIDRIAKTASPKKHLTPQEVTTRVELLLETKAFAKALVLLDSSPASQEESALKIHASLRQRAREEIQYQTIYSALSPQYRMLAACETKDPLWPISVLPFLTQTPFRPTNASTNLLNRLLVDVDIPKGDLLIEDLRNLMAEKSGVSVRIDQRSLDDYGIDPARGVISEVGRGKLSLLSFSRFALEQLDLTIIEKHGEIVITTPEEADEQLITRVLPVGDLIGKRQPAKRELLAFDPTTQRLRDQRRKARLAQLVPLTVDYKNVPYRQVLLDIAEKTGHCMMFDMTALNDVGLADDDSLQVTLRSKGDPAKVVLARVLEQLELTSVLDHEAIIITTEERAWDRTLPIRLHSGLGLVPATTDPLGGLGGMGGGFGFGGGMGGGGAGGGSFGGGLGGMGAGGIGGGGGGNAPFAGTPSGAFGGANTSASSTSRGGEGESEDDLPSRNKIAPSDDELPEADKPPATGEQPFASQEPGVQDSLPSEPLAESFADFQSIYDVITRVVEPDSWEDVGGPFAAYPFPLSVDLVVAADDDVHDQIESLLEDLQKAPAADGLYEPPTGPQGQGDFDPLRDADYATLVDVIGGTVRPDSWVDVGGPSQIEAVPARQALVVAQTAESHRQIGELLTDLRRSIYQQITGDKPWEFAVKDSIFDPHFDASTRNLPQPRDEELELLEIRQLPKKGAWTWQEMRGTEQAERSITLRTTSSACELKLPNRTIRFRNSGAAIHYPAMRLVEVGLWNHQLYRVADSLLPWMPHRTNRQLASMFHISKIDRPQSGGISLRLTPTNLEEDANTYFDATYTKAGKLVGWDTYLLGELATRLRFDKEDPQKRTLVSTDGKLLASWRLVPSGNQKPKIPQLTTGWDDAIVFDHRPSARESSSLVDIAEAMREGQWEDAASKIRGVEKRLPTHPFLALLHAWCIEQLPSGHRRGAVEYALSRVMKSDTPALQQFVTHKHFPSLTAMEFFRVLESKSAENRQPSDWLRLIRAALNARMPQQANELFKATPKPEKETEEIWLLRIEILLASGQLEKAATAANDEKNGQRIARLTQLAERYQANAMAVSLLVRQLNNNKLNTTQRASLLLRLANVQQGTKRWNRLIDMLHLLENSSHQHRRVAADLLSELQAPEHAEIAGLLAKTTKDAALRYRLLARQAILEPSRGKQGHLYWALYQAGEFPIDQLQPACAAWQASDEHERLIIVVEGVLRRGTEDLSLSDEYFKSVLGFLANAYQHVGREQDAQRARSQDPKEKPVSPPAQSGFGAPFGGGGLF